MEHDDYAPSSSRPGVWIAMLVVALLTGVAIWLVPDEPPAEVEAIPRPQLEPPAASGNDVRPPTEPPADQGSKPLPAPPAAEAPEPAEMAEPAEPVVVEPPRVEGPEGSAARALLQANPQWDNETLVAEGRRFQRQGKAADAWLLYFQAARRGSAEAALALAEQADPAYFDPATSALSEPDLVQAHKWYRRAQAAGSEEADRRLQRLLEQVARRAQEGDQVAALLLQEWKKRP